MKPTARVLVTGGAGYLGSILVPHLLHQGFHVTVLDNLMYQPTSLLDCCHHEHFHLVRGDCRNPTLVKELLENQDIILPLAALVGAPLCDRDPLAAETTNVHATQILCQHAKPSQKILFPTTNSGYGIGEKGHFCTEATPLRPISLYGKTKVKAEEMILNHPNALSFRLATVFGIAPRMRLDLLVNDFVYRAMRDRALVVFEGHFKRNYLHIRDVARAFIHAIDHFDQMKGQAFNVGLSNANLSKLELCQKIQTFLPDFYFTEAAIGEDPDKRDYIVSNDRILATGFQPLWDLDRGITELIKGFQIINRSNFSNV